MVPGIAAQQHHTSRITFSEGFCCQIVSLVLPERDQANNSGSLSISFAISSGNITSSELVTALAGIPVAASQNGTTALAP